MIVQYYKNLEDALSAVKESIEIAKGSQRIKEAIFFKGFNQQKGGDINNAAITYLNSQKGRLDYANFNTEISDLKYFVEKVENAKICFFIKSENATHQKIVQLGKVPRVPKRYGI